MKNELKNNFEIHNFRKEPEKPADCEYEINKLDESFLEMRKRLIEVVNNFKVIPEYTNFEIKLQESETRVNLILKQKEGGKEEDLNSLLPPGYYFTKGEIFGCHTREKKICFPEHEMKYRGSLISLLHEIGHSYEGKEHPRMSDWDVFRSLAIATYKLLINTRLKKEVLENEKGKKTSYRLKLPLEEALLPRWYLDKLDKKSHFKAKSERNAWTYALKLSRKLEQDGFDIFTGFKNASEVRDYIAYHLSGYDIESFIEKLDIRDIGKIKELINNPIFSKGGNMYDQIINPSKDSNES